MNGLNTLIKMPLAMLEMLSLAWGILVSFIFRHPYEISRTVVVKKMQSIPSLDKTPKDLNFDQISEKKLANPILNSWNTVINNQIVTLEEKFYEKAK